MYSKIKFILVIVVFGSIITSNVAYGQQDIYLRPNGSNTNQPNSGPAKKYRLSMLAGFKTGYNLNVFDANINLRNGNLVNYNDASANFFIVFEDRKSKIEIGIEPGYMRLRGGLNELDKIGTMGTPDTHNITTWNLHLINLPIALRYVLVQSNNRKVALYGTAGVEINLLNAAQLVFEQRPKQTRYADAAYNRITDQMSKSNARLLLGVGGRYHISAQSYCFLEAQNMFGSGRNALFVYNQSGQKFNLVFDTIQFSVGLAARIF